MKCKVLFAFVFWMLAFTILHAQQLQRHEAIVAYIYNFAKNIQWKNESSLKEFHFTIITNDADYQTEFNKLSKTKTLKDLPIRVTFTNKPRDIESTQLVFLDNEFESDLLNVLDEINERNTLLITDKFEDKRFVMINFVQSGNNKLQFEINKANILNQKLVIMPTMILLGGSEIDVASLYKESQQSLLSMQKKLDNLTASSEGLKVKIKQNEMEIATQNRVSAEQNIFIQKQKEELAAQHQNLSHLQDEARNKKEILDQKNLELKEKERKTKAQENQIQKGESILKSLNASNDSLSFRIKEKERVLSLQGYTIASQKQMLYGLIIIIGLTVFSIFIVLRWYWQKNKINQLLTTKKEELEKANTTALEANELLARKSEALQISNGELNLQKEEIAKQRDIVSSQNEELVQSQEEIAAQRDLVAEQNKQLEESRAIIEKQNEEIIVRNENLEKDVENRTRELVNYNQQLEQFAFISAHNLRAPVARILGLGQILELSNLEDEKYAYDKLIETTKELDRVVRDLNTILEIRKNNTSVITEINLTDAVELVKLNLAKELTETMTTLEIDFSNNNTIRTVRPYLDSILINLISNAIKYRHPHRAPKISIRTELIDNYIRFVICDNGLGIDLELYKEKLFKLYHRFHDHVEGKGLGLYLVKTQVIALGGTLEIESEVNKGTTFYIYLKSNTV